MGKRKLHDGTFFQCEWTGYPMRVAYCYLPDWNEVGKLQKKGAYCNWESVVAHAQFLLEQKTITEEKHQRILDHVTQITGAIVHPAPPVTELMHMGGTMREMDYHAACVRQEHPITAVKLLAGNEKKSIEVIVTPDPSSRDTGRYNFAPYLHQPFQFHGAPSMFHSITRRGAIKGTNRDLAVWYYPSKDLPYNTLASDIFRMQLHGDVLIVQQSREQSFIPRERFVSYTTEAFNEHFNKKRRKPSTEIASMSNDEYDEIKKSMQSQLNAFEQEKAAAAEKPGDLMRAEPVRKQAKSLAKCLKERADN